MGNEARKTQTSHPAHAITTVLGLIENPQPRRIDPMGQPASPRAAELLHPAAGKNKLASKGISVSDLIIEPISAKIKVSAKAKLLPSIHFEREDRQVHNKLITRPKIVGAIQ